jgi:hypothetical protein
VVEIAVAMLVLGYVGFLQLFPNEADCVASGRIVDPTHRHCQAAAGDFVQLREHVILHSWEALFYAVILAAVGFAAWYLRRRLMRRA